ncbi:hypothetical protein NPIL_702151 [Nephila pilipes]|uniref:Uncharacterized protein n=1 Tax=Nephila pilipes TaxID=299642 RepID=A0A8X6TUP1_NEPPI|nr:hypothetical protein NPIL_702151 [Nephila pilipes]
MKLEIKARQEELNGSQTEMKSEKKVGREELKIPPINGFLETQSLTSRSTPMLPTYDKLFGLHSRLNLMSVPKVMVGMNGQEQLN